MRNIRKFSAILAFICAVSISLTACNNSTTASSATSSESVTSSVSSSAEETGSSAEQNSSAESKNENSTVQDKNSDGVITLSDGGSAVSGSGITAEGQVFTITKAGTYRVSGKVSDGQIIVDCTSSDKVTLILDGADITCKSSAPIYLKQADKLIIELADNSQNVLTDSAEMQYSDSEKEEPNACIFAKDDITIKGDGALTVNANFNNGIQSKNDIKIKGGNITVNAVNNAVKGKDGVEVSGGVLTLTSGGNGISSTETEDGKGNIEISGGVLNITSTGGDAVDSSADVTISGGEITMLSGGGSQNAASHSNNNMRPGGFGRAEEETGSTSSVKGIKSDGSIIISGGVINADCADDAIHANGDVTISSGILSLVSGDDGVHAGNLLAISGGEIDVKKSYEGLEGLNIEISGGKISVTASDDGINAAGGNDLGLGGAFGQDVFGGSADGSAPLIKISGGTLYVNASGDGIDSNGNLEVCGGEVYVSGPENSGNGALDIGDRGYTAAVSGGTLIACGAQGMEVGFTGSVSSQYSFMQSLDSTVSGGTELKITDSSGKVLLSFTPEKSFKSVVFTSPELKNGETYTITAGSASTTVTITDMATNSSSGGFGGMGGHGGMGGDFGGMGGDFGGMGGDFGGMGHGGRGDRNNLPF